MATSLYLDQESASEEVPSTYEARTTCHSSITGCDAHCGRSLQPSHLIIGRNNGTSLGQSINDDNQDQSSADKDEGHNLGLDQLGCRDDEQVFRTVSNLLLDASGGYPTELHVDDKEDVRRNCSVSKTT